MCLLKKLMRVGNQPCTVPQRTIENKNNALNYEYARPDRIKVYRNIIYGYWLYYKLYHI
jgi:hypothetical protein